MSRGHAEAKAKTPMGKRIDRLRDGIAKLIIAEFDINPDDLFLWDYDTGPPDGAEIDFNPCR